MALALPRFAVIQSTLLKTYLLYKHRGGGLQLTGEEIVSPYAKFAIEGAKGSAANHNGFVHIRCCYNNKYWVAKSTSDSSIIAGAAEPNEDQSKSSCTLFKLIPVGGEGNSSTSTDCTVRFRHVQLGRYLSTGPCLIAQSSSTDPGRRDFFGIIDWESLVILPKNIAFKGDNGLYLSARSGEKGYLEFAYSDKGHPKVGNEVFITKSGSVRIKNNHFGKFWRNSHAEWWDWICADSDDNTTNNSDILFSLVKVADNTIALRNLGNKKFCIRNNQSYMENCLKAQEKTISKEARLVVEELIISRVIHNVKLRLMDARICNQQTIVMTSNNIATNHTGQSHNSTLKLSYKITKSSNWNGSVSLKLGVQTTIKSGIPFIAQGKVQISGEFAGSYQWGETMSTEELVESNYTVPVPPMSKVTVSLLATQGSCEVPFSYSHRDTLMNGDQVNLNIDDGIYTGRNCFNFHYDTKTEKL